MFIITSEHFIIFSNVPFLSKYDFHRSKYLLVMVLFLWIRLRFLVLYKSLLYSETTVQRCTWEKVFSKCATNLQEKIHAKVRFTLQRGCSPVNLLYISGARFPKNTSERLLLCIDEYIYKDFLFYWSFLVANFETYVN